MMVPSTPQTHFHELIKKEREEKETAMANTSLSSLTFSLLSSINPTKLPNNFNTSLLSFNSHNLNYNNKGVLCSAFTSSSISYNSAYLEREFGGHGVSFSEIGDSCVVKMGLENGSTASLMLPSGLITSYKPHMWHGSTIEVLHTVVSEGEKEDGVVVQGGVYVDFKCVSDGGISWSPKTWALHDVRGSPLKFVQVELICSNSEDMVEFKYLVTLQQDLLGSELSISNSKSCSLQLEGSVLSHLSVSTPDAAYAVGLQGSNYFNKQPLMSNFSIIPPSFGLKKQSDSSQSWGQKALQGLMSGWVGQKDEQVGGSEREDDELGEKEEEEDDNYAQLTEVMSRIYTSAPSSFTVIDRGKRNSVVVGRSGFDELFVFSPGSEHDWYGKYAYICTGPSAMLKPVVLSPQSVWTGAQYLHNPSL